MGAPTDRGRLLEGRRALVTGASRGLGRAIASELAAQGAWVAINYSADDEGAESTRAQVEAQGAKAMTWKASVLDAKALAEMVGAIEKAWERVDVLVNNAGVSQPLPLALMEEADWDRVMDINVKGSFLATRAVVRGMIRRRAGCILNIGSLAGVRLLEAPIHYCASKAAIKGFTESLSKELARYGIRVNCLAPGLLEEGVSQNLPEHRVRQFLEHVALGRKGTLEEVARCAAFMVSDRASYMNGVTLVMDGGL